MKRLWYHNLPNSSLLDTDGSLNKNLLLTKFLTPYFIIVRVKIKALVQNKLGSLKLDNDTINLLNQTGLNIFFWESLLFYNEHLPTAFPHDIDTKNIKCEALDDILDFISLNNLTNITIYTCDYNINKIKDNYPTLSLNCLDVYIRGLSYYEDEFNNVNKNITTKFWCGNWKYNIHRHIVASYLTSVNTRQSWHYRCSFNNIKEISWLDLSKFPTETLEKIRTGCNFLENNKLTIDYNGPVIPIEQIYETNKIYNTFEIQTFSLSNEIKESYNSCFCCVITESVFAQPFGNFSEKTLNAIYTLSPFVIVAPPHTLEYMKRLGFKTFDQWWDESYDEEEDHQKRLLKIFEVIDYINKIPIDELRLIYQEMASVLEHNRQNYYSMLNNNEPLQ